MSDEQLALSITTTLLRVVNRIEYARRIPRNYGTGEPLTLLEVEICLMISRAEGITGSEISQGLGVTQSAISQTLTKLRQKKLIVQRESPNDGKRKLLY